MLQQIGHARRLVEFYSRSRTAPRRMVTHKHASDELSQQTVTDSRFARPNHQSYSDQLLPGMADRAALVVWGARPWQFGGLGARPCFLVVCLPKPPPTIWIAAVCNGKPPQFTGCCTKQPKRNPLFAVLPPKPPTTIWIVAVCYGQPPQFTVCCTKQLKRSSLLTALPPSFSRSFMRRWRLFSFAGTGLKLTSRAISRGMVTG